jgi:hypothetical protein
MSVNGAIIDMIEEILLDEERGEYGEKPPRRVVAEILAKTMNPPRMPGQRLSWVLRGQRGSIHVTGGYACLHIIIGLLVDSGAESITLTRRAFT